MNYGGDANHYHYYIATDDTAQDKSLLLKIRAVDQRPHECFGRIYFISSEVLGKVCAMRGFFVSPSVRCCAEERDMMDGVALVL